MPTRSGRCGQGGTDVPPTCCALIGSPPDVGNKLRRPLDGQWGSLKDNGQWTGMIKELLLKEADIGIMSNIFYTWHIS